MMGFDVSVFRQPRSDLIKKILFILLAESLIAFGIAFNSCANLGNDPISVISDGIHNFFKIDLGIAFNISNYTLLAIMLILGRRYLNIGTFLGTLPSGFLIDVGVKFYNWLSIARTLECRVITSIVACAFLSLGIAIFVVMDIGQDPWTGLALMLSQVTSKQFKFCKILIDLSALGVGFLLGGKVGPTTLFVALMLGPTIQFFVQTVKKLTYGLFEARYT